MSKDDEKVILFPKAAGTSTKARNSQLRISTPDVLHNHINLGPWEFTCPKCDVKTKFECQNMIFRTMDFYCGSCGSLHRVVNPAFIPAPPKKPM